MQRITVKVKLLLCWQGINQIYNKIEKYQNKKDFNMLRKIKLLSIKFQQEMEPIFN